MSGGATPLPLGKDEGRRRERLEEIRRQIQQGDYEVDASLVAEAILEHLRPTKRSR